MDRITAKTLSLALALAAAAYAESIAPQSAPLAVAAVPASQGFQLEWSQGEPFVGAAEGGSTATHGFQVMREDEGPTAMVPAASGLSLIVLGRTATGYRFAFDEARVRYVVKLFGAQARLLRMFVVYPGQDALLLPYAKLPSGPAYLTIHNEAGHPLQTFKLFQGADS
jgi:hypothetical protein